MTSRSSALEALDRPPDKVAIGDSLNWRPLAPRGPSSNVRYPLAQRRRRLGRNPRNSPVRALPVVRPAGAVAHPAAPRAGDPAHRPLAPRRRAGGRCSGWQRLVVCAIGSATSNRRSCGCLRVRFSSELRDRHVFALQGSCNQCNF